MARSSCSCYMQVFQALMGHGPSRSLSGRRGPRPGVLMAVLLAAALCSCASSGCWGKRELEDRSLVTIMGVDLSESGRVLATTVIAVPRAVGGGGKMGGGGATSSLILSGEGRDISEALSEIELLASREISTVHMAFVVLGEGLAGTDVAPVIDIFSRSLSFRHNTMVAVCKGRAIDFLKGYQSVEEAEPSLYLTKLITTVNSSTGGCPLVTMHEFMVGYNTLSSEPWAPYVSLASAAPAEDPREETPRKDVGSQAAGGGGGDAGGKESPEKPTKVISVLGAALFRKIEGSQRMCGYLDTGECAAALIMRNALRTMSISIPYPGDQTETSLLLQGRTSTFTVDVRGEQPRVRFTIRMTAAIEESLVGSEEPEVQQEFRKAIVYTVQDQLEALLRRAFSKIAILGTDVLGLGRVAQSHFSSYGDWEEFNWPARFVDATATFDVKLHVYTAGFTIQKPFPR